MGGTIDSGGVIRHEAHGGNWGQHDGLSGLVHNDYAKLLHILQSMNPDHVQAVGDAYKKLASRLAETIKLLENQATVLSESWTGRAAENGSTQMQGMYNAVRTVNERADTTGNAMDTHAATQRKYRSQVGAEHWYGADMGTAGTGTADWFKGESHMAHVIMNNMQTDTVHNNNKFPPDLRAHIPLTDVYEWPPGPDPRTPSSSAVPINTSGDNGAYFAGVDPRTQQGHPPGAHGAVPPGQHGPVIGDPGSGSPSGGSQLAGFNPPPAPANPGVIGGPGGMGGPGLGMGGAVPFGAGMAPMTGAFRNGVIGAEAEELGAAAESEAIAAEEAAAGRGSMGRGLIGGNGEEEEEHERSTKLKEDDKSWAQGDDLVPPVIG